MILISIIRIRIMIMMMNMLFIVIHMTMKAIYRSGTNIRWMEHCVAKSRIISIIMIHEQLQQTNYHVVIRTQVLVCCHQWDGLGISNYEICAGTKVSNSQRLDISNYSGTKVSKAS